MEDDLKRREQMRQAARTSERAGSISAEDRTELARHLSGGRGGTVPDAGFRRSGRPIDPRFRRSAEAEEAKRAAAAARVEAQLQSVERRLARMEGSSERGRYQVGEAGSPTGRYARLLSRADRLERRLRSLR